MKIAVSLNENHHHAQVDEHFGRCDWYGIYDTITKVTTYLENPNRYASEGAGCSSADMLIREGVGMCVAGRFGTKTVDAFRKSNVQMVIPDNKMTFESIVKLLNNR